MNSGKALFVILGGVALTTVIGFLLTTYGDSSKGKEIVDKARENAEIAEEAIKDSVANVKKQLKKMDQAAERMVNEGGNTGEIVNGK